MMTTSTSSSALVLAEPVFSDQERLALAGFLAGYSGMTREAYALDLRQFTAWRHRHQVRLPVRLRRDRPARPAPGCQPHLVVLDVMAADVADRSHPGVGHHPAGELAQRVLGRIDACLGQEQAQLPQVARTTAATRGATASISAHSAWACHAVGSRLRAGTRLPRGQHLRRQHLTDSRAICIDQ
jgi:hypothetical protein